MLFGEATSSAEDCDNTCDILSTNCLWLLGAEKIVNVGKEPCSLGEICGDLLDALGDIIRFRIKAATLGDIIGGNVTPFRSEGENLGGDLGGVVSPPPASKQTLFVESIESAGLFFTIIFLLSVFFLFFA